MLILAPAFDLPVLRQWVKEAFDQMDQPMEFDQMDQPMEFDQIVQFSRYVDKGLKLSDRPSIAQASCNISL